MYIKIDKIHIDIQTNSGTKNIRINRVHISFYKASKTWKFEICRQKRNKYFSLHLFTHVLVIVYNDGVIYDI